MRRLGGALAALTVVLMLVPAAVLADDGVDVSVTIPSASAAPHGPRTVDDSVLSWAINPESGSGAFFGGCNFLSAGKAGDSGSSRLWLETDGLYKATSGNVTIEKPGRGDTWAPSTWADKCLDARGATPRRVTTGATDYGTGNRVVITGGTGTIDPSKGTASLHWSGSFSVVFYGGLTYWHATDPVLTVADGKGTLRARVGGYGASMEDTSKWIPLTERTVTLATFDSADLSGELGFSGLPSYLGVKADPAVADDQETSGANWGTFPMDFVAFQREVGQAAYWYSSGGVRDFAKPPYPVSVSWSAAERIDDAAPIDPQRGDGQSGSTGAKGSATSGGSAAGSTTAVGPSARGLSSTQARASALAAPQAPAPPAAAAGAGDYPATTPDALQAGVRGLIPAAAAAMEDPRARFVIASSALVAFASIAIVGFRRRWLILPWSKHVDHG